MKTLSLIIAAIWFLVAVVVSWWGTVLSAILLTLIGGAFIYLSVLLIKKSRSTRWPGIIIMLVLALILVFISILCIQPRVSSTTKEEIAIVDTVEENITEEVEKETTEELEEIAEEVEEETEDKGTEEPLKKIETTKETVKVVEKEVPVVVEKIVEKVVEKKVPVEKVVTEYVEVPVVEYVEVEVPTQTPAPAPNPTPAPVPNYGYSGDPTVPNYGQPNGYYGYPNNNYGYGDPTMNYGYGYNNYYYGNISISGKKTVTMGESIPYTISGVSTISKNKLDLPNNVYVDKIQGNRVYLIFEEVGSYEIGYQNVSKTVEVEAD